MGLDPHDLHRRLQQEGGFSVNMSGRSPRRGEMVARHGSERTYPGIPSPAQIQEFVGEHQEHLAHPHSYVGGWVDTDDDPPTTYLDVSQQFTRREQAKHAASANDQISRYDVAKERVVSTEPALPGILDRNVDPANTEAEVEVIRARALHRSPVVGSRLNPDQFPTDNGGFSTP